MAYRRLMARVSGGSFTTVNSAGSRRASDRVSTEHAGSILAVLPIQGYSVWFLGRFRTFFETRGKTKIRARTDSHGTRDSDAPTSPGGGAAGVPLRTPYRHAVLRIAAAFGPRTPHILRRSCAVSLQNVRKKRRLVQKANRTGRATATRRRRQAASRLAFHCANRIDMRFCYSLLRLVHGRRTSCVDRVPSASKEELSRPLEAVMDPTCSSVRGLIRQTGSAKLDPPFLPNCPS